MADRIVIELDLEKGDVKGAVKSLAAAGEKAGKRSGKEFAKKFNQRAGRGIGNLAKAAGKATAVMAGLGAALATVIGVKSIRAAQVQEDAINSLNSALLITKNAGIEASGGIQEFASELQKTTRFGDEVILQNAALIQSLGDLDEQGLKRATRATADLATALRIDLGAAAVLVGKAAAGEVSSFSRYGLSIQKAGSNAETFAKALSAIETKFGGAAQRDVVTFSGATDQLSNAFGDVFEEIGFIITQNPKFVKAIKASTDIFVAAGTNIKSFADSFDLFDVVTKNLIRFNDAVITNVIAPLEMTKNLGKLVFDGLAFAVQSVVEKYALLGKAVSGFLNSIGLETDANAKKYRDFTESTGKVSEELAGKLSSSLESVYDFPISDKLSVKNDELRTFFQEQNQIAAEQKASTDGLQAGAIESAKTSATGIKDVYASVFDGITSAAGGATDTLDQINGKIKKFSKESGKQLITGIGQGSAQAFASFGAAVATGGNALDAFTQSLFKSIGQQTVALGTRFMLEGAAMLFSTNPDYVARAPGLISNGAALAAFGGAIGASSGGGGGASGGGGGGGAAPSGTSQAFQNTNEELASPTTAQAEERVNLSINVEGSLVRQEELGQFITETLNESFSKQGLTLTDARFA